MLHRVELPFADTRAAHLRWSVEHPLVDPLVTRGVHVGGVRLDLRVLGASHQVAVLGTDDTPTLVETVAYLPGVSDVLPRRAAPAARPTYSLRSHTHVLTAGQLTAQVEALVAALADDPLALLARFPGDPCAVTALQAHARADGVGWRTWHAYPQHGELVETRTALTTGAPAPPARPAAPPTDAHLHPRHRTGNPR